jgi:hypothetical protein
LRGLVKSVDQGRGQSERERERKRERERESRHTLSCRPAVLKSIMLSCVCVCRLQGGRDVLSGYYTHTHTHTHTLKPRRKEEEDKEEKEGEEDLFKEFIAGGFYSTGVFKLLLLLFQRTSPAPNYNFAVRDLPIVRGEGNAPARMLHSFFRAFTLSLRLGNGRACAFSHHLFPHPFLLHVRYVLTHGKITEYSYKHVKATPKSETRSCTYIYQRCCRDPESKTHSTSSLLQTTD